MYFNISDTIIQTQINTIISEEVLSHSEFPENITLPKSPQSSMHSIPSTSKAKYDEDLTANTDIFTIPYRTLSCHNIEDFSKNTLQTYVSTTLTAEAINILNLKNFYFIIFFLRFQKLRDLANIDFKIIYSLYNKNKNVSNADKVKLSKTIIKLLLQNNLNLE